MKKQKKQWNVLVFPGGNEIGLEIYKSLSYCKEVKLYSVSSAVKNHAPYVYKKHFEISEVSKPSWLKELNTIITKNKIDYLYPAHVFVIDELLKKRDQIKCKIVLPSTNVVKIVRSKKQTANLLKNLLPTPKIFNSVEEVKKYPVHVKPDNWYGQQKSAIIDNKIALKEFISSDKKVDFIIQEYLPGEEYTIDCLSDEKGRLLFCGGRIRNRIRMGTSMNASIVDNNLNKIFSDTAKTILKKINLTGAWFFQMKADSKGVIKLLEIEPRIAGTMALNRARGVNFPLLSLFIHDGFKNVNLMINKYKVEIDRALVNRYKTNISFNHVYIDLDHTIIMEDGLINVQAINFLYQCINENKKITLISKSLEKDRVKFLKNKKIFELFDDIIWLDEKQSKADFINPKNAIFIDDSFSQRKEVFDRLNIPTFDPSMIEIFIK